MLSAELLDGVVHMLFRIGVRKVCWDNANAEKLVTMAILKDGAQINSSEDTRNSNIAG
jgi:hypothetical protein